MMFEELLATVQLLESRSRVMDAFIDSLWSYYVIVTSDFDISMGDASLANSVRAFHYPDPLNPVLGPSQGGDSTVSFFCTVSWRL